MSHPAIPPDDVAIIDSSPEKESPTSVHSSPMQTPEGARSNSPSPQPVQTIRPTFIVHSPETQQSRKSRPVTQLPHPLTLAPNPANPSGFNLVPPASSSSSNRQMDIDLSQYGATPDEQLDALLKEQSIRGKRSNLEPKGNFAELPYDTPSLPSTIPLPPQSQALEHDDKRRKPKASSNPDVFAKFSNPIFDQAVSIYDSPAKLRMKQEQQNLRAQLQQAQEDRAQVWNTEPNNY